MLCCFDVGGEKRSVFDGEFSCEFILSRFWRGDASEGILTKVEEWVDRFGKDSVDLNDDVREKFVETLDFSSFGGGELVTETLVWGGHQRRVDIVEGSVHIVMGSPGDEDDVTLIYYTMKVGGRGNDGTFGETLHVEMSPIWEFAGDKSAKEGVDLLILDVGGG